MLPCERKNYEYNFKCGSIFSLSFLPFCFIFLSLSFLYLTSRSAWYYSDLTWAWSSTCWLRWIPPAFCLPRSFLPTYKVTKWFSFLSSVIGQHWLILAWMREDNTWFLTFRFMPVATGGWGWNVLTVYTVLKHLKFLWNLKIYINY